MAKRKTQSKRVVRSFNNSSFSKKFSVAVALVVFVGLGGVLSMSSFAARQSCEPQQPVARFQNTYKWAQWGTYAKAGERVRYLASVTNQDLNCGTSKLAVNITVPDGFTIENPVKTVTLDSSTNRNFSTRNADFYVYVTSPTDLADGNYPLEITATKEDGTVNRESSQSTSYYKVYSTDTTAPQFYWTGFSGVLDTKNRNTERTFNLAAHATDDHKTKRVTIKLNGKVVADEDCTENIVYSCSAYYPLELRKNIGNHVAEYRAEDFSGNVKDLRTEFVVK